MVKVLDRIQLDGEFGTVRYVGTLPAWGDALAYGIEWDNAERGKNDGSVNGVQYFSVENPRSGSFVKASNKKLRVPRSFVEALVETYAGEQNVEALAEDIVFGSKKVESLGFERLNQQQAQLVTLESVTLDKKCIGFCGDVEQLPLLPKLTYLDLTYNLLVDMREIEAIAMKMPNLRHLNINGNIFTAGLMEKETGNSNFERLDTLHAASCNLETKDISVLLKVFPNITTLCVAGNRLAGDGFAVTRNLSSIDFSFNSFTEIPDLDVRELILANNKITTFQKRTLSTMVLDLRENPISDWKFIDSICDRFPDLQELRIDGCKLFEGMSVDEMTTQLIGRLRCSETRGRGISKLNGSTLSADEIRSAELYVISELRQGRLQIHNPKRLMELAQKYGPVEVNSEPYLEDQPDRLRLEVKSVENTTLFSRVYLLSNTVLRLKGTITKHTNVPVHRFKLYYYPRHVQVLDEAAKTYLDDDVATLAGAGLENHDCVFYEPALS